MFQHWQYRIHTDACYVTDLVSEFQLKVAFLKKNLLHFGMQLCKLMFQSHNADLSLPNQRKVIHGQEQRLCKMSSILYEISDICFNTSTHPFRI